MTEYTARSRSVTDTEPEGHSRTHTDSYGSSRTDTAVYAIPRSAVVRRRQDSLLLGAPLSRARGTWLMHVLQAGQQCKS